MARHGRPHRAQRPAAGLRQDRGSDAPPALSAPAGEAPRPAADRFLGAAGDAVDLVAWLHVNSPDSAFEAALQRVGDRLRVEWCTIARDHAGVSIADVEPAIAATLDRIRKRRRVLAGATKPKGLNGAAI